MALRGATCFIPMSAALFLKDKVSKKAGTWAILLGPLSVILWELLAPSSIDSLFIGILVSIMVMAVGTMARKI